MSPRRPHLRNRKKIKAPRRFDDEGPDTSSPRQDSHEESEESSELEEETYKSPEPKKPKSKARAYRGKVIEFNPNLPPAAFPTLDHPDYVHNGGNVAIDLESCLPGSSQSGDSSLADFEAINPETVGRNCHLEEIDFTEDHSSLTSNTTDFSRQESQILMQTSIMAQNRARASILVSMYGEPTDNGPRNPVWASNMARIEEAGNMSDMAREIMDMDSDEEDLSKPTTDEKFPAWADLTVTHKLDLADAIGELYPNAFQVMHQLRLSVPEKKELSELLMQRQERDAREEANQQRLQEQTKDALLQDKRLSQSTFHEMVETNLYGPVDENDQNQTSPCELEKARAYLRYCGFDPALADKGWDVPAISNAADDTQPRPAQKKPRQSKHDDVLLYSEAQNFKYPPNPRLWPKSVQQQLAQQQAQRQAAMAQYQVRMAQYQAAMQQRQAAMAQHPTPAHASTQSTQGALPQHHPTPAHALTQSTQGALPQYGPTPTHALIAQHSPAAHRSQIPVQSYRVAPNFRALQEKPNTSTSPDLQALPTAGSSSEVLPAPQGHHSPQLDSHSQASKPLPTGPPRNETHQSNGDPYMGALSPQESGGAVETRNSINKRKRKKSAD